MTLAPSSSQQTTQVQTFVHLFKGYIGPGCLSIPWAFSQMGVPLGALTTLVLFVITSYNALLLVWLKRRMTPNHRETTYSDIGGLIFGDKFRHLVTLCVSAQQLGICTVFFSFVADNIVAVVRHASGSTITGLLANYHVVVTLVLPFSLLLTYIPNLKQLSIVMEIATVLLFLAFALLGGVIAENWDARPDVPTSVNWTKVPMAICAILYSFEGINLILPVESAMIEPKKFDRIFILAMLCVATIFATVGAVCVATFGQVKDGSVTAYLIENMDSLNGDGLILAANAVVSFSVLFTYPLQMFPAITLIAETMHRRSEGVGGAHHQTIPSSSVHTEGSDFFSDGSGIERGKHDATHVGRGDGETGALSEGGDHSENGVLGDSNDTEARNGISDSSTPPLELETDEKQSLSRGNATAEASPASDFHASLSSQLVSTSDGIDPGVDQEDPNEWDTGGLPGDSLCLRTVLVLLTYLVAMVIPNVQELISLVGALAGSLNALIIPPLLKWKYEVTVGQQPLLSWTSIKLFLLLSFGIIAGIWGTAASIADIVRVFMSE